MKKEQQVENKRIQLENAFLRCLAQVGLTEDNYSFATWHKQLVEELEDNLAWFEGEIEVIIQETEKEMEKVKKTWINSERNTKSSYYNELKNADDTKAFEQLKEELTAWRKNPKMPLCSYRFLTKKKEKFKIQAVYIDMKRYFLCIKQEEKQQGIILFPYLFLDLPFGLGNSRKPQEYQKETRPTDITVVPMEIHANPLVQNKEIIIHEKKSRSKKKSIVEMKDIYTWNQWVGTQGIIEVKELTASMGDSVLKKALQALTTYDGELLLYLWQQQKQVHTRIQVSIEETTKELNRLQGKRLRKSSYEETRASIIKMGMTSFYLHEENEGVQRVKTVRLFSSLDMSEEASTGFIWLRLADEVIEQFMNGEVARLYQHKVAQLTDKLAKAIVSRLERERQMLVHQKEPTYEKTYHLQELFRFLELRGTHTTKLSKALQRAFQDLVDNELVLEGFEAHKGLRFTLKYLRYTPQERIDLLQEPISSNEPKESR